MTEPTDARPWVWLAYAHFVGRVRARTPLLLAEDLISMAVRFRLMEVAVLRVKPPEVPLHYALQLECQERPELARELGWLEGTELRGLVAEKGYRRWCRHVLEAGLREVRRLTQAISEEDLSSKGASAQWRELAATRQGSVALLEIERRVISKDLAERDLSSHPFFGLTPTGGPRPDDTWEVVRKLRRWVDREWMRVELDGTWFLAPRKPAYHRRSARRR